MGAVRVASLQWRRLEPRGLWVEPLRLRSQTRRSVVALEAGRQTRAVTAKFQSQEVTSKLQTLDYTVAWLIAASALARVALLQVATQTAESQS